MKKRRFTWSVFLPFFAAVILALVLVGCNNAGEPPKGEHPEQPKAEGTKSEHPEQPKAEEKKLEHPEQPKPEEEKSEHPEQPKAEPEK
jgi:outer membrane biosynthesis protein TonB